MAQRTEKEWNSYRIDQMAEKPDYPTKFQISQNAKHHVDDDPTHPAKLEVYSGTLPDRFPACLFDTVLQDIRVRFLAGENGADIGIGLLYGAIDEAIEVFGDQVSLAQESAVVGVVRENFHLYSTRRAAFTALKNSFAPVVITQINGRSTLKIGQDTPRMLTANTVVNATLPLTANDTIVFVVDNILQSESTGDFIEFDSPSREFVGDTRVAYDHYNEAIYTYERPSAEGAKHSGVSV